MGIDLALDDLMEYTDWEREKWQGVVSPAWRRSSEDQRRPARGWALPDGGLI